MKLFVLDVVAKLLGIRFRVDGIPYGARLSATTVCTGPTSTVR
jgi:hypothetical protein